MPRFKGGNRGLTKFINKNLKFPRQPLDSIKNCRRVELTFIVAKDGSVKDVKVVKSASPAIDSEAIRVIELMPRWDPGLHNGKPVAVKFKMPIDFETPPDPMN